MKIVATNKKAKFEYFLLEKFKCGIVLQGSEVKSIRNGGMSLDQCFIDIKNGEMFIKNCFIKQYDKASSYAPDTRRDRKLLLNKAEIYKINEKVQKKGFTLIPVYAYFDRQYVKIEIALAKGKKLYDKRESLKQADIERNIQKEFKNNF